MKFDGSRWSSAGLLGEMNKIYFPTTHLSVVLISAELEPPGELWLNALLPPIPPPPMLPPPPPMVAPGGGKSGRKFRGCLGPCFASMLLVGERPLAPNESVPL